MDPRRVNLIVTEAGSCPLLQPGDCFSICEQEVSNATGKICCRALHSLFHQINGCLEIAPESEISSHGPLVCTRGSCGTTFRAQILPIDTSKTPKDENEAHHRN